MQHVFVQRMNLGWISDSGRCATSSQHPRKLLPFGGLQVRLPVTPTNAMPPGGKHDAWQGGVGRGLAGRALGFTLKEKEGGVTRITHQTRRA